MKTILCTTTLTRWNLDTLLDLAHEAGCDGVELPADPAGRARSPADPFLTDPRRIQEKLAAHDVALSGLYAEARLEGLARVLELAEGLQCPLVRSDPPECVAGIGALVARFPSVTVLFNNVGRLTRAAALWAYLDRIEAGNIGASYRPSAVESPWVAVPVLNSRIKQIHPDEGITPELRERLAGIGYGGAALLDPPISESADLATIGRALKLKINREDAK